MSPIEEAVKEAKPQSYNPAIEFRANQLLKGDAENAAGYGDGKLEAGRLTSAAEELRVGFKLTFMTELVKAAVGIQSSTSDELLANADGLAELVADMEKVPGGLATARCGDSRLIPGKLIEAAAGMSKHFAERKISKTQYDKLVVELRKLPSEPAIIVKLADITENLDEFLDGLSREDIGRHIKVDDHYETIPHPLAVELVATGDKSPEKVEAFLRAYIEDAERRETYHQRGAFAILNASEEELLENSNTVLNFLATAKPVGKVQVFFTRKQNYSGLLIPAMGEASGRLKPGTFEEALVGAGAKVRKGSVRVKARKEEKAI